MLRICTYTAAFFGLLGMLLGLMGGPYMLIAGTLLVSAALIATSIQSLKDK